MNGPKSNPRDPGRPLREQAEAALRTGPPDIALMSATEIQKLVYELQVHQIELQMQNEELHEAHEALAQSRDRFADLYDFAPAGYVTLDSDGTIIHANLTMAALLGVDRMSLDGHKFSRFVMADAQDTFYFHQQAVLASDHKQTCDLELHRADGTRFQARMETVCMYSPGGGGRELRCSVLDVTQRRQAEEALVRSHTEMEARVTARTAELAAANRELEANQQQLKRTALSLSRLAAIVESSGDAIIGCNLDGIIETWNAGAEDLFGYTGGQIIGKPMALLVPPEGSQEYRDHFERTRLGHPLDAIETMRLHRDGHLIDVSLRQSCIRNDEDGIIGISAIARDISRRKRADELMRESEARFRRMADHSPILIWINGPAGQRTWVNRRWLEFTGRPMEESLGENWLQQIHPEDRARCREASGLPLESGKPRVMEYRLRRQDGAWRWMLDHSIPLTGQGGEFTGSIGSCFDITVREEAERRVRAALAEVDHLKAALDEHSIVAVTDSRGRIILANDRFCEISGYSREELLGRTHRIISSGKHSREFFHNMWETIGAGQVWRGEIENRAKDGRHYFVATTIVPRPGPDGKPEQYVAIRTDVTELKAASGRLERLSHELAAKNRDLETLIHAASHDLRSPLVNVQGFAALISEQTGQVRNLLHEAAAGHPPTTGAVDLLLGEIDESLHYICAGAEKMDSLLKGLLIFSRLGREAVFLETLDAGKLVGESLAATHFQLEAAGATVSTGTLPPCHADANLLGQTFSNLIDNAIKYRDPARPLHLEITGAADGGRSIYRFSDNGIGIAPEHREKVFELFHRLNPRQGDGHGLGLAIVRRAMDRMGGTISLESSPSGGAVFILSLPATGSGVNNSFPQGGVYAPLM